MCMLLTKLLVSSCTYRKDSLLSIMQFKRGMMGLWRYSFKRELLWTFRQRWESILTLKSPLKEISLFRESMTPNSSSIMFRHTLFMQVLQLCHAPGRGEEGGWGCNSTPTFYRRKWIGPHHRLDWWEMCLEAVCWALDSKLSQSLALQQQSGPTRSDQCQTCRQLGFEEVRANPQFGLQKILSTLL